MSRPATRQERGVLIFDLALLLFQPDIMVGAITDGAVDIPFSAQLRSRHAVIKRLDNQYFIEQADPEALITVQNHLLTGPRQLQNGDRIVLGTAAVVWHFRQREPASGTAVLEFDRNARSAADNLQLPCNHTVDRIALVGRELHLGPSSTEHLCVPELPCQRIRLIWLGDRLHALVEGGSWAERGEANATPRPLSIPSEMRIFRCGSGSFSDLDDIVWLLCRESTKPFLRPIIDPYATGS